MLASPKMMLKNVNSKWRNLRLMSCQEMIIKSLTLIMIADKDITKYKTIYHSVYVEAGSSDMSMASILSKKMRSHSLGDLRMEDNLFKLLEAKKFLPNEYFSRSYLLLLKATYVLHFSYRGTYAIYNHCRCS